MASDSINGEELARVLGPIVLGRDRLRAIAQAAGGFAPKAVRLNRLAGATPDAFGFAVEDVPWLPEWGYWPVEDVQPGRRIPFGAGLYYVQDAGSLLPVRLLNPQPGEVICDLCAAPGGKTTAILEALGPSGGVLANEAIRGRVEPLRLNLARQGASRFVVSSMDPEELAEMLPGAFDAVLADVPCSGQSLVGSGKQRTSCFDVKLVDYNAARQRRILSAAARLLGPGGRIVYSTCTFSWAENEGQVEAFLSEHSEFKLVPDERLTSWQGPGPSPQGCYRLWPARDRAAGVFAARMIRTGGPAEQPVGLGRGICRSFGNRKAEKTSVPPWQEWGSWAGAVRLVAQGPHEVAAMPVDLPAVLQRVIEAGQAAALPEAARLFGKTWHPGYALAMRRDGAFVPHQAVELSDDMAGTYLRGEAVAAGVRGWAVGLWKGWPLGWLHGAGWTASNKLEKAARLTAPQ